MMSAAAQRRNDDDDERKDAIKIRRRTPTMQEQESPTLMEHHLRRIAREACEEMEQETVSFRFIYLKRAMRCSNEYFVRAKDPKYLVDQIFRSAID